MPSSDNSSQVVGVFIHERNLESITAVGAFEDASELRLRSKPRRHSATFTPPELMLRDQGAASARTSRGQAVRNCTGTVVSVAHVAGQNHTTLTQRTTGSMSDAQHARGTP